MVENEHHLPTPDEWEIVKAINADRGEAQVFRLRKRRPDGAHVQKLATALSIRWPYDPSSIFPKGQEKESILSFERAIDWLAEENGHSELVLVATGLGWKEWLYYVDDPTWFMTMLNDLLSGHESFPLTIDWYDDPAWKLWQEMLDAAASGRVS